MSVPEKHRAVAHAWVDGAEVEAKAECGCLWVRVAAPEFHAHQEYRIKPKAKVKKWRWVVDFLGHLEISKGYMSEKEASHIGGLVTAIEKIDATEKEDDE